MSKHTRAVDPLPGADELVDVVDEANHPLAVMRLKDVHQQHLRHRAVFILVYDAQGKIYLQKRSAAKKIFPGHWDISAAGHVKAGEPCLLAALRELEEELGLTPPTLKELHRLPANPDTGFEHAVLYSAGKTRLPLHPNPDEVESITAYDREELDCLAKNFRGQLTPALFCF